MIKVAALWLEQEELHLFVNADAELAGVLAQRGGVFRPALERWVLPLHTQEELGAELDRLGYRWAAERSTAPRTWAAPRRPP